MRRKTKLCVILLAVIAVIAGLWFLLHRRKEKPGCAAFIKSARGKGRCAAAVTGSIYNTC